MNKNKIKLLILVLFFAVILSLRFSGLTDNLNWQNFLIYKQDIKKFVNLYYLKSSLIYILFFIISSILCLPIIAVITLAGGFLFDTLHAVIYINIAATIGAIIMFLIARYSLKDWVQNKFKDKISIFNKNLDKDSFYYLVIVRFVPGIPFFLVNFLAGLTKIKLSTFIMTTSIGILPVSIIYAFAGKQIETINNLKDIFSCKVILALSILVLLFLLPIIFKKIKK